MGTRLTSTVTTAVGTAAALFAAFLVAAPGDAGTAESGEPMRIAGSDDRAMGSGEIAGRNGNDTRLSDVVRRVEERHAVRVEEAEREFEQGRNLYELEVTGEDGLRRTLYVDREGEIVRRRRDDD